MCKKSVCTHLSIKLEVGGVRAAREVQTVSRQSVKAGATRTGELGPLTEKELTGQAEVESQRGCWVGGQGGCAVGKNGFYRIYS